MKAFVINLDKDKKRLKQFYRYFKNCTYQIERIAGIYGKNVPNNELSPTCQKICTDGMKGCAASHKSIWKKIVDEKIPVAIVFEDDAFPDMKNYEEKIDDILQQAPNDFDVINLFTSGGHEHLDPFVELVIRFLGLYIPTHKIISKDLCIPEFTTTTVSYIISNNGAKKLLKLLPKISGHVDAFIYRQYKSINIYSTRKSIFIQKFEHSNNTTEGFTSIVDTTMQNGIKLSHILGMNNFKIMGINISLYSVLRVICILLIVSLVVKNKRIFLYSILVIFIVYIILLKLSFYL